MASKLRISLNTVGLYFENIVNTVIGILVVYNLSRYLGPEAYGHFSFVVSFILLFLSVFEFGVGQITIRELAKYPDKKEELMGSAMFIKTFLSILSFIACWCFYFVGHYDTSLLTGILIYSIRLIFAPINLSLTIYRLNFINHISALINIVLRCVYLFLIYLIVVLRLPLNAVFVSLAFTEIMVDVARSLIVRKGMYFHVNCDFHLIKEMLRESWPLGLSVVCISLYMRINMVLLPKMVDYYQIGIYAAAERIVQMLFFIPESVAVVLFPLFSAHSSRDPAKGEKLLLKSFDYLAICGVVLCILLFVYSKVLVGVLFGNKFDGCEGLVRIFCFQLLFVFVGIPLGNYLVAVGRQRVNLVNDVVAVVINLFLFVLCTFRWGIRGSAYAALATKVFLTLFMFGYFLFVMKIKIKLYPMVSSLLLLSMMFLGLRQLGGIYSIPGVFVTLGLFVLLLVKLRCIYLEDLFGGLRVREKA